MTPQRGGRTRRLRMAGSAPSSAATSTSSRLAASARRGPSFAASSASSAPRWRRPASIAALLRLDPWRLHVGNATTVASPRVWRADSAYR